MTQPTKPTIEEQKELVRNAWHLADMHCDPDAVIASLDELAAIKNQPVPELPPLTDIMYHAVRGLEFDFGGGWDVFKGQIDDDCLDEIWDAINTAIRCCPAWGRDRAAGVYRDTVPVEVADSQPVPVEPYLVTQWLRNKTGKQPLDNLILEYIDTLQSALQAAQQEADNQFKYAGRLLEQTYELETALKAAQQERDDAQSFNDDQRQLCGFYQVSSKDELINAQAHHIEKLQSKLPPLKDEHPWNYRQG